MQGRQWIVGKEANCCNMTRLSVRVEKNLKECVGEEEMQGKNADGRFVPIGLKVVTGEDQKIYGSQHVICQVGRR